MLVLNPESRWPIRKILKEMALVLSQSRKQGRATDYCCVGKPWPTSIPPGFPPVWTEDDAQRHQTIWHTQLATKSHLTRTKLSGTRLIENINTPTKAIHSTRQLEQFGKSFFNDFGAPGAVNIRLIRNIVAVTGSGHAHQANKTTSPQIVTEGETSGRRFSARLQSSRGTTSEGRRSTADSQGPNGDASSLQRKKRRVQSVEESETPLMKKRRL